MVFSYGLEKIKQKSASKDYQNLPDYAVTSNLPAYTFTLHKTVLKNVAMDGCLIFFFLLYFPLSVNIIKIRNLLYFIFVFWFNVKQFKEYQRANQKIVLV